MRPVFSFRVRGGYTVRVGRLLTEHAGHRPVCCGFRRVQVSEPGALVQDGRSRLLDVRQLRRDYRRAYESKPRKLTRAERRANLLAAGLW